MKGFTTSQVQKLLDSRVAKKKVGHAVGNAMSLNVILRLIPRIMFAAGLITEKVDDPWKHLTRSAVKQMSVLPDDLYRG